MATISYGNPLAFLGTAFLDIDSHPAVKGEPASPTTPRWARSRQSSTMALNEGRRETRSMTDSWETLRTTMLPQEREPSPRFLPRDPPVCVYAPAPPPQGEGFFGSLCRKLSSYFGQ